MIKRPFEQWLFEQVEIEFDIERIKEMPELLDWLNNTEPSNKISQVAEKLRISLLENVETWNEDELKMLFISPFLLDFNLNNPPYYRVFTQRSFTLQTENIEASGRVEWFVATGKQTPKKPFFFLQEYKPEKNSGNDPLGQLLIAMINAQKLNQEAKKTFYGAYTIGRFWFFIILKEKTYSVSRAYDATQKDDMSDMIVILKKVKKHIHKELNLP